MALVAAVSCTPVAMREMEDAAGTDALVWPEPPEQARIRYLYSFYEPVDLGIKPGVLERFVQIFAGNEGRRMARPYAIAVDGDLIAVADPGLSVVHMYLTQSEKYQVIAEVAGVNLVSPVGVALSAEAIYVTDSVLGKVFVLGRDDGKHRLTMAGLQRPTGIVYHPGSRRLFVTDTVAHRIVVFDDQGSQINSFGTRGGAPGEFNYPSSLTLHGDLLYVNDTMNFRIQTFDLDGKALRVFGEMGDGSGQFAHSKGMGADPQGHLYVADALSNYIQIFDQKGRFLLAFGGMGSRKGQFMLPAGIFILGNRIFVADSQNRRVQVFEYIGGES